MHQEIGKHVKNDISSIAIMTTLKKYFKFGYMVGGCAIRNIHFLGTIDDWKLLREKANQFQAFTMSGDEFRLILLVYCPFSINLLQHTKTKSIIISGTLFLILSM